MPLALDILNEIADRLGWKQIESIEGLSLESETRKLLRLLNRVLSTLGGLDDWPMLRKQGEIVLVADVVADTTALSEQYLTATQNDATITIDNFTGFNTAYIGAAFQAGGYDYVYRIESINSSSSVELNRAWIDASITATDEVVWTIAWDRYALPENFDRPVDDFSAFLAPYGIDPVSPEELAERRRRRSGDIQVGEPEVFTIFGLNEAQTQEILHLDPWPDAARLITYDYIGVHPTIDSDNDKILFPRRVIEVVMEMVIQLAYRDYEDDDRMQQTLVDMIQKYNQSIGKKTVTQNRRIMRPDGHTRREIYRAYRAGGGNVDWGDTFDRAGNVGFF
jgi:hypothetical protein